ncbi:acyl-CoA dehydrogenase [Achromobacter xylosoxidans]|jgi:alkylation response protein AidB-like acyl-CoA dehydrogenase|uniref:Acyl-CoA dehydrogenase n=4 Tax=Alcaligenaceae TaxID=506 RepID=A0A1R1JZP8_ALCXX|nr:MULTISPECIES: acyl-CoA dehydrogenase family protein [Achromobacter]CAB3833264.1 Acyl-CoA dehydrogenase [Achromobacter deleyi]AZS81018.1 acyl-CoA dehydrogenase [Achromobacter spanius]OFS37282.1 acyl-CoA dehydrogenase [Achromobacter xylosoxidans]OMG92614.1 acyl-CoA dehydrogenase [Achromobacter xylosoxidans]CAB3630120.1 Acyl-CoA dehydrogenase [Achromobacter insuavis]
MDFNQTEEQIMLRSAIERLVHSMCTPEKVRQWDRDGSYPEEVYAAMVDAGFVSMVVPAEYGGMGSPMSDCIILYEEVAKPSVDFATRIALQAWGCSILADVAPEELKREFLPRVAQGEAKLSFSLTEPSSGSDAASLTTSARRDGDDWLINGQKVFSSGADAPDNHIVLAVRTAKSDKRHDGISLFLVPNDLKGITIRRLDVIGRRVLGLSEIYFDDVRVPSRYLLGEEGKGWGYIGRHLERERITLAANYLGCASSALNDATIYAQERKQFGRPIGQFQAIAHMLADMATEVECGRWLTAMAAWRYDNGLSCRKEASMAKLYVSEMLQRVTASGMQILGGHAYTTDHAMQRHWRDARNATVGGGTSQIQRELIARELGL